MMTSTGLIPVGKSTLGAKVGVVAPVAVVLRRMEMVLLLSFATAKSGFPSPLMSPMLTEVGSSPVRKGTWGAKVGVVAVGGGGGGRGGARVGVGALVGVVLSRMDALSSLTFVTAKSGFVSPLMSPMLRE